MALKPGLGRGLDALLQKREQDSGGLRSLPIDRLEPNRRQPRTTFDEDGLRELAASIEAQGVIQPLVVAPSADDRFVIVAGERRWRAARLAGLDTVPVVVRERTGDRELLELALVENLQRADLNAIEEAEAYRSLRESFALSQGDIAAQVGKSRATVTNSLRLLRLPAEVQDLLRDGSLSAGQARPLLALETEAEQVALAQRAVDEGLSARRLEAIVQAPRGQETRSRRSRERDVHAEAAAERLTRALQTKVEIVRRGRKGSVRIPFGSEEELMMVYDRLMQISKLEES